VDCYINEDKKKAIQSLKTSKGQIDGIIKMIENGRYCMDISNQIVAAQALLKRANLMILRQHLDNCVKDAFLNNKGEEKVDEIMNLLKKLLD
jgi:CsoR family transcriptional regulator, copper-sensing transcriptional repressor